MGARVGSHMGCGVFGATLNLIWYIPYIINFLNISYEIPYPLQIPDKFLINPFKVVPHS